MRVSATWVVLAAIAGAGASAGITGGGCAREAPAGPQDPGGGNGAGPVRVEVLDDGFVASVEADRLVVAPAQVELDKVLVHLDGDSGLARDRLLSVYELRLVASCPVGSRCIRCNPDDPDQPDCTGIPPLPPRPPGGTAFAVMRAPR